MVVTSIVSSTLLSKLAEAAGVAHYETLTGFKWIVRPALDNPGARFVFGYEEALGFATNDVVRDKDGISAAITFLIMLDRLRRDDRTPFDVLEELAQRFGRHASAQQSIRFPGAAASDEMMVRLQSLRDAPPSIIGGRSVADIVDYTTRQPAADILRFDLEEGARVMMRPSGTEPKLKIYVEIVTDRDARAAQAMADALAADAASLLI
jgi:phosphomannomutase